MFQNRVEHKLKQFALNIMCQYIQVIVVFN